jgi:hypothetical protein
MIAVNHAGLQHAVYRPHPCSALLPFLDPIRDALGGVCGGGDHAEKYRSVSTALMGTCAHVCTYMPAYIQHSMYLA